jgi:hypothetical protein
VSFESCIRALTQQRDAQGRPAISQADADAILARHADYMARGLPKAAARAATMKDFDALGARKARQRALILEKWKEIKNILTTHTDRHGQVEPFEASFGLFEGHGYEGFTNIRSYRDAVIGRYFDQIADALEHFRRATFFSKDMSLKGGRLNTAQYGELRRTLHGESASPEMQKFAGQLKAAAEYLRTSFNDLAGDTIPKLEKWHNPQSHDPHAVHIAGGMKKIDGQKWSPNRSKEWWSKFISPLLDWSQMRDPWTGQIFGGHNGGQPMLPSEQEKMRILGKAWEGIVTGGDLSDRPSMAKRGGSMLANSRSDHRYFVFKDANSQATYAKQFGRHGDDILSEFIHYGTSMANDIAMMRVLGPNPDAMVEYIKQFLAHEANINMVERPGLLSRLNPLTVRNKVKRAHRTIDGFMKQFRGDNGEENNLALSGTILRNYFYGSLLGGAAVAHVFYNPVLQMSARNLGGLPMWQMFPHIFASMGKSSHSEMLRAGFNLEEANFQLGRNAEQLNRMRRIARLSRWWPDRIAHWSGLSQALNLLKDTFMRDQSAMVADNLEKEWSDLPPRMQLKMKGYGLTEPDWNVIQMVEPHVPWEGLKMVRMKDIADVGARRPADVLRLMGQTELFGENGEPYAESDKGREDAQKKAEDVALRFGAYMHGEKDEAVGSYSMRAKAFMRGNTDPNTWLGQIVNSTNMFHSFQATMIVTNILAFQQEYARGKTRGLAWAASLFLALWALGTAVLCTKAVLSGKDVPPLDPTTHEGRATWVKGLLQGSFPWLGEVLLEGATDRGKTAAEMLAGPVAGNALTLIEAILNGTLGQALLPTRHPSHKSWQSVAAEYAVGMVNNNPLSTLWYTKAPFARLVHDQLQANLDPDGLRRQRKQEENLARNNGGQRLWWKYGDLYPHRGPHFTDNPVKGVLKGIGWQP